MKKHLISFTAFCLVILFSFTAFAQDLPSESVSQSTSQTTVQKKKTTDERAEEILKKMSLEEKAAQMFMAYVPSKKGTAVQKKNQFGGYVLFAGNFKNSNINEKKKIISGYQKVSKIKMLIAVDEEGGIVNRVSLYKQYRKTPFGSPQKLYKKGGYKKIKKDTAEKAKLLKSMGINTNLAPVADVPYKSSDYMYSRSFSTSASKTSKYINTVVTQMGKSNMVSTLKHFPGYGGNGDTHSLVIRDKRSKKTFESRDLKPFKAGIKAGADMIMVSHNIVECFDKKNPASISKKVHKYIRNELGFDGVIITDGLTMSGVVDYADCSNAEIAVKAIIAGNDMLCTAAYKEQLPAVIKAIKSGRISEEQINESVLRILKMKLKRGIIK